MEKPAVTTSPSRFLAETHEVTNVARELQDYNPYATDIALREGVAREGAAWADAELHDFGDCIGRIAARRGLQRHHRPGLAHSRLSPPRGIWAEKSYRSESVPLD